MDTPLAPVFHTPRGIAFTVARTADAHDALPVLLVHGHFGSRHTLLTAATPALGDRDVASLDLPWHGDSVAGDREHIDVAIDAIAEVLDTLGWDRCVAIGHSWGAQVLLAARARLSSRFAQLLLLGLPGDPDDNDRAAFNGIAEAIRTAGLELVVGIASTGWYSKAYLERVPSTPDRLRADLEHIGVDNVAAVLRTYANGAPLLPTLVREGPAVTSVVMKDDGVIRPGVADAHHRAVDARVVVVDGGHFFFEEDPARFHALLRDELAR